jgi:hypothetical protein
MQVLFKGVKTMPYYDIRAYLPVTAYTTDVPVLINDYNVNTTQLPALNFKPAGSSYAYIYVPAVAFTKAGANVYWDNAAQHLVITAPNCKDTIAAMQSDINLLKADSSPQQIDESNYGSSNKTTSVQRITTAEIQFDAAPVVFPGNFLGHYTLQKSYPYYPSAASGGQRGISVKDNFGVWHLFGYHIPLP